jgi:segregation and condensation protein B
MSTEENEESQKLSIKDVNTVEGIAPVLLSLQDLPAVIESFIFAASEPLSIASMKEVFERQGYSFGKMDLKEAMATLLDKWNCAERTTGQGLELVQLAGGYVFRTNPRWGFAVRAFLQEKPQKLTTSQLEVLAMVAYRQPVTRVEVEEIRGVDSSSAMRRLLSLKLIKILGKSEGLGRPLLYGTTKQFLEFFGLNSLHDLPTLKEYQDMGKDKIVTPVDVNSDNSVNMTDLFVEAKEHMFSENTEKLSQEALKSLEEALGAVVHTTKKLDIEQTLKGESEFNSN